MRTRFFRLQCMAIAAALVLVPAGLAAKPSLPESDSVVLERLPEKGDPALAQLKRMRAVLMSNPRDLDIAVPVVRKALEAARTLANGKRFELEASERSRWRLRRTRPISYGRLNRGTVAKVCR